MQKNNYAITQKNLARNIRSLRELREYSQEYLALQTGIDRTYISKIERGIANPSLKLICDIAFALDVELHDLIKRER